MHRDMDYNFFLKHNITRGHLPCLIMTFQKVLVASTFLKPEGKAASGSPHSISCQQKTIDPTGPKFSAPLNEMHTEQQKKTGGRYCCGGESYSHISSGQFLARILYGYLTYWAMPSKSGGSKINFLADTLFAQCHGGAQAKGTAS